MSGRPLASRYHLVSNNTTLDIQSDLQKERGGRTPRRHHHQTLRFVGKILDREPADLLIDKLAARKLRVVRQASHCEFC